MDGMDNIQARLEWEKFISQLRELHHLQYYSDEIRDALF